MVGYRLVRGARAAAAFDGEGPGDLEGAGVQKIFRRYTDRNFYH